MSTASIQSAMMAPNYVNGKNMDQSDLEAFLDFSQMGSPSADKGKGRLNSQTTPTITSPPAYFDLPEDTHTPMQPSHDYSQYRQQIGLPSTNVQSVFSSYNNVMDSSMFGGESSQVGGMMGVSGGSDLDSFLNFSQGGDDLVDPSFLLREEQSQPIKYFPGMHQQQAELAKQMMMKQKQMEAAQEAAAARRASELSGMDQMRDETISRVMSEMRRNSSLVSEPMSPSNSSVLPHIARIKKDEEDMDEDERLLNSEEGKKLSSKERRQLRNKVSARAFRSRRKEYIGQLEGQIAAKSNEVNNLKRDNAALMAENARFHRLAEKLISHPAFMPYIEELSRDPSLADAIGQIAAGTPPASQTLPKDVPQFNATQQFVSSNNDAIVGMTLIPEMPVDLSSLNIGSGQWPMPSSMDAFRTSQVFAVTETEIAEPFDVEALSGKPEPEAPVSIVAQYMDVEDEKPSFPEIDTIAAKENTRSEKAVNAFDENDPCETLFAAATSSAPVSKSSEGISLFGNTPAEKVFARFELVDVQNFDEDALEAELMVRFARLENLSRRLDTMTSSFRC